MPLAKEVAMELRKLADSLDKEPEADVPIAFLHFYACDDKARFLALAAAFPHPFAKEYEDGERGNLELKYETSAAIFTVSCLRSAVCRIVEPAKPAVYECEPLLSLEEDIALEEMKI